eukprot:4894147-Ditylum_brightwellii.AAC.1
MASIRACSAGAAADLGSVRLACVDGLFPQARGNLELLSQAVHWMRWCPGERQNVGFLGSLCAV